MDNKEKNICVGCFYENKITKEFFISRSWDGSKKIIVLYSEKRPSKPSKVLNVTEKELEENWILRKDLRDFPFAFNPLLPYEFDLWWDIKLESELVVECLQNGIMAEYDDILKRNGCEPISNRLQILKEKYKIDEYYNENW